MERYQLLRWAQGAFHDFRAVPPGMGICHQVNLEYLSPPRLRHRRRPGLLRHAGRHRLAHHHGQRPRRARLGRRRDRGRGGHARPAAVHAAAAGRRAAHLGRAQARHHGDRRRAHGDRAAARPRRGRRLRRVLRARRRRAAARDAGHHRQHEPRVRGHLHHVPDRPGDPRLPALHRARRGAPGPGRGLRQGAGPLARPRRARAGVLRVRHPRPGRRGALAGRPLPPPGPGAAAHGPATPSAWRSTARRARPPASRRRRPTTRCRTATSSSPPSPAAPTRRTPRSWSAAGLLAKKAVERGLRSKPWVKTSLAPGLAGRHGLPGARRAHGAARAARLLPRRLRLHDLHRQLRPAARGRDRGGARTATCPSSPCCRATATSRGASTPTCG